MQFVIIALSGLASLAAAASSDANVISLVAQLPSCSVSCLEAAATSAGCGASDYSCQCSHTDAVEANATSCLTSSCSISNITTTQKISTEICAAVNGTSSTSSNSSSTGSSSSSSASSTGGAGTSAGTRAELIGLGWAAVAGVVGLMVL